MPADCELLEHGGTCGVLAVGRCKKCGRAFCASHQVSWSQNPLNTTAPAECVDCRARHLPPLVTSEQATKVNDRTASQRTQIRALISALREGGVPQQAQVHGSERVVRTLLGRTKTLWKEEPTGLSGWNIGTVEWERHQTKGDEKTVSFVALVTAEGDAVWASTTTGSPGVYPLSDVTLLKALARACRQHGVPVE